MVAHIRNPTFGRLRWADHMRSGIWDQPGQHGETQSLLKIQKLAQRGCAPVIPATWEAEAWEPLEPGRRRLQWAKILPLHSSLGNRARLCLKRKRNRGEHGGKGRGRVCGTVERKQDDVLGVVSLDTGSSTSYVALKPFCSSWLPS